MKLCMGCMNQMDDNLYTCPHCGFDETNLRQESYYLDPGTVIGGKYIVGKVLSYGGYTVSYMGYDAEYNNKVVIKEYLPSDFSTRSDGEKEITIYSGDALEQFEQGLTNFLNEANRIQTLQNPEGIAKVYDCVAENDTGYVITEYLEGQTLKEILDGGRRFGVEEAKAFISQILRGLCKVHPMNIIHCDISPETIFVTNEGEIKLLDFGATRYVTTANSKSLAIILKQGYAPEEQYRSRGVRGTWTDVYALGAVMYRMITGVVPQESVERALVDELKEPSKLGVSIPAGVENAIMNALNVFQEERTQSAKDFLDELNFPNTKRIKVKKRKNDVGKFPLWAKVLVACLFCAIIVGGVVLLRSANSNSGSIVSDKGTNVFEDFRNQPVKEVKLKLEEAGFEVIVKEKYKYSDSAKNPRLIYKQLPMSGTECNLEEPVILYCHTNESIRYEEIKDLSAYALAKELDPDSGIDNPKFEKVENVEGNYYEILSIEKTDGTSITSAELQADIEKELKIRDISKICYCANSFFYWENGLDNYAEKRAKISELDGQTLYKLGNETDIVATRESGNVADSKNLVNDVYYSFTIDEGTIVEQWEGSLQGTPVDERFLEGEYLFHVIKRKFDISGTANTLKAKLEGEGLAVEITQGHPTQRVNRVSVVDKDGNTVEYFTADQDVTIKIVAEEKKKPKPQPKESEEETTEINVNQQTAPPPAPPIDSGNSESEMDF